MKIRIHHFFDIIRDFGSKREITPHPYLHSYHSIAQEIKENPDIEFEMVVKSDEVCINCVHLTKLGCDDLITHRNDFIGKEDFNNHVDTRIMEICGIQKSNIYSPRLLCEHAHKYIENIQFIYDGNDFEHTQQRKKNVILGLKYYSEKHSFPINLQT